MNSTFGRTVSFVIVVAFEGWRALYNKAIGEALVSAAARNGEERR